MEAVALDSKRPVVDAPRDTVEPVVERTRDVDYGVQEVDGRHLVVVGSRCPVGVGNSCIGGLEVAVATRALRYGCCFGGSCHGCYQSFGSSWLVGGRNDGLGRGDSRFSVIQNENGLDFGVLT